MACDLKLSHNDPKQVVVGRWGEVPSAVGGSDETRSHKVPQGQTEVEEPVQHVDLFVFLPGCFHVPGRRSTFSWPMSRLWNLSGAVTLPGSRKTEKGASKCKRREEDETIGTFPGVDKSA
jgi:hypothetical protein